MWNQRGSARWRPSILDALLVLSVLAPLCSAHANGAFPDEFSIHFPPGHPERILVGANFGLLVSEDQGATWRYSCEPYVTSGSSAALSQALVSFYQVTADDAVLADSINVTRSADLGCTWPTSGGSIAGKVVTDIFPDPNDATFVLAIVATLQGTLLVASHDGGATFAETLYATSDALTGIEAARSTPGVLYATQVSVDGSTSTLLRSGDRGAHWDALRHSHREGDAAAHPHHRSRRREHGLLATDHRDHRLGQHRHRWGEQRRASAEHHRGIQLLPPG